MPGFQTKVLVVTPISGDNFRLIPPNRIFFFARENRFLMLFQTCTKLTFGLSDVFVITVITRRRINSVGLFFVRNSILRFGSLANSAHAPLIVVMAAYFPTPMYTSSEKKIYLLCIFFLPAPLFRKKKYKRKSNG